MLEGLCYKFYYGLDKIKHYRLKYIRAIKKNKNEHNKIVEPKIMNLII